MLRRRVGRRAADRLEVTQREAEERGMNVVRRVSSQGRMRQGYAPCCVLQRRTRRVRTEGRCMVTRKSEGGRGNAKVEFMVTSAEGNNNSRRLLFSLLPIRTLYRHRQYVGYCHISRAFFLLIFEHTKYEGAQLRKKRRRIIVRQNFSRLFSRLQANSEMQ